MTQPIKTLQYRIRSFIGRYRTATLATIAVLGALALIAAQVFNSVQHWLIGVGIFQYLTLLVALDIASVQDAMVVEQSEKPKVSLFQDQDHSLPGLIGSIPVLRPTSADLLEFAGASSLPLFRSLCRERTSVRLLLKHPESVQGLQPERIVGTLDTLLNSIFVNYPGEFEVRCYRRPYSLRGRRLGFDTLELSWLTPDESRSTVFGHANPSLVINARQPEFGFMSQFFTRTFEELWTAPDTEDGRDVLRRSVHDVSEHL